MSYSSSRILLNNRKIEKSLKKMTGNLHDYFSFNVPSKNTQNRNSKNMDKMPFNK